MRAKAQELFKVYVEEGAEQQVNVPAQIVATVAKALSPNDGANAEYAVNEMTETPFTANVFEPARKEVHELMRKDTLPRFVASDRFVALRSNCARPTSPSPRWRLRRATRCRRRRAASAARARARGSVFISAPVARVGGRRRRRPPAAAAAPAAPTGKRAWRGSVIAAKNMVRS